MAATSLITFNDGSGTLKTKEWLVAVGGLYRGEKVVDPYRLYGTFQCTGVLAPGQGRYGGDAFKMTMFNSGSLPDFYLIPYDKGSAIPGTSFSTPAYSEGYTLPVDKRANRLHIWLKYPSGFRQRTSSGTLVQQNYHIGTYHRDPGVIAADGSDVSHESNGWHFYHQIIVRHDLAQDQWVHICLNQRPTHKRDLKIPCVNPTRAHGNYWETATRIYFAPYPYGPSGADPQNGDAEIPGPYDVLIDSIYMDYVDEYHPVDIQIENWKEGQIIDLLVATGSPLWNVTLTNTTNTTISGNIDIETWWYEQLNRELLSGTTNITDSIITLAPNEVRQYKMRFTPTDVGFRNLKNSWELTVFNASGGTYLISGVSSVGTFFQTTPLSWNSTPAQVEAALDAFSEGTGFGVSSTGGSYPYRITASGGTGFRTWTFRADSSNLLGAGAVAALNYVNIAPTSVSFVPFSEETNGRYGTQIVSKASPYVCYEGSAAFKGYNGPPDADICTKMFDMRFWDALPPACKPICYEPASRWRLSTNTNLSRQLPIFDVSGLPMTVSLIDWEARSTGAIPHTVSGGGSLSISSGGLVNFVPNTNFQGIVAFRYKINNGVVDSINYMNWIIVSNTPRAAQAAGKLYTSGGRLITYT